MVYGYANLVVFALLMTVMGAIGLATEATGWRPQSTLESRSAIIREHLGVTFIKAHDGMGTNDQWWYCVNEKCYKLPEGVGEI